MLDLRQYDSLGAALGDALERWPDEICLIEADRDRENCRLTYRQFKEAALPLARALQQGGFRAGDRAAIIMTNQSKWLLSAYAVFCAGGVLVPLDYKLTLTRRPPTQLSTELLDSATVPRAIVGGARVCYSVALGNALSRSSEVPSNASLCIAGVPPVMSRFRKALKRG